VKHRIDPGGPVDGIAIVDFERLRALATGVAENDGRKHGGAVTCFMEDLEACIMHRRFSAKPRQSIQTTNSPEQLYIGKRDRLKIVPETFNERPRYGCFGALKPPLNVGSRSRSASSNCVKCPL
jgi:hypothetical protein